MVGASASRDNAIERLDPSVRAIVDAMGDGPYIDLAALPLDQAMSIGRRIGPMSPPPPNSEDRTIKGYEGADLRMRLYFPPTRFAEMPVLLHLHGGGFVTGSIEMDDARCVRLAREARCIVASLDYRLAPEHPFPIPIEDAFAAWRCLTSDAGTFGGDVRRCAVSGSSAGGHLAVGVALLARERGVKMPLLQLLTYPVIDPGLETPSYRELAEGPFLTRARMAWYWSLYAGEASPTGALWSPMTADPTGLPPAMVITAEHDVLRDEGEAWAAKLRNAGIAAAIERYEGMIHGFVSVVPDHDATRSALANSAAALRDAFARAGGAASADFGAGS